MKSLIYNSLSALVFATTTVVTPIIIHLNWEMATDF